MRQKCEMSMCFLWLIDWKLLTVASESNLRRTMFLSVKCKAQMSESGMPAAGGMGMVELDRLGMLVLDTLMGVVTGVSLRREFRLDLSFVV